MKSVLKLMKRFFSHFALFRAYFAGFKSWLTDLSHLWQCLQCRRMASTSELTGELQETESGGYILTEKGQGILEQYQAWGLLIQDGTGEVLWHSENLPKEIPLHYTISEISALTLGYIADYPTTTASKGADLLVLGHPKKAYWKMMHNTYDYSLIEGFPKMLAVFSWQTWELFC